MTATFAATQAVKEKEKQLQQQAEDVTDAKAAPTSAKEQAAAEVEKNVTEAAPEEDLGDTLSTLQGAASDLQQQKQPQVWPGKRCSIHLYPVLVLPYRKHHAALVTTAEETNLTKCSVDLMLRVHLWRHFSGLTLLSMLFLICAQNDMQALQATTSFCMSACLPSFPWPRLYLVHANCIYNIF